MKKLFLIFIFLAGCSTERIEHYKTYDAGSFAFKMPNELEKIDTAGIDSYVLKFKSENININFDYGPYSYFPSHIDHNLVLDYKTHQESIAGSETLIESYRQKNVYSGAFPFYMVANFTNQWLRVTANCERVGDYSIALKIFKSVKFKQRFKK